MTEPGQIIAVLTCPARAQADAVQSRLRAAPFTARVALIPDAIAFRPDEGGVHENASPTVLALLSAGADGAALALVEDIPGLDIVFVARDQAPAPFLQWLFSAPSEVLH